jgi:hypothetical protein
MLLVDRQLFIADGDNVKGSLGLICDFDATKRRHSDVETPPDG